MWKKIKRASAIVVGTFAVVGLLNLSNPALAAVPGVNERVSLSSTGGSTTGGDSLYPLISANGSTATFYSNATNILPSGGLGVFARNLLTGTNIRVNVSTAGVIDDGSGSTIPQYISSTGRYIGFRSPGTNLIDGVTTQATSNNQQLYVRDTTSSTTMLISQNASGVIANGNTSAIEGISSDGRFVLYYSNSTNLHSDATDGHSHLYMLDRADSSLTLLDRKTDGTLGSTNYFAVASMSCDGSLIAFQYTDTLTASDTNGSTDIYLLDRRGGANQLTDLTVTANHPTYGPSMSCNGDFIGFKSTATNIDSSISTIFGSTVYRPYIYDRVNGAYHLAAVTTSNTSTTSTICDSSQNSAACIKLSDIGVGVFSTNNSALTGTSQQQVYIRNIYTGMTELVSRNSGGAVANGTANGTPDITANGSKVIYTSDATNLISPSDTNNRYDVYTSLTGY